MTKPLVSVLIPLYNHEKYIDDTITSVLESSFKQFEIVVIDDGSKDRSLEKVKAFRDERIRLFQQENQGAHVALNRAAALSKGRFLAVLNSDDKFHPNKLQEHLEFHESHPNIEATADRVLLIDGSGSEIAAGSRIAETYSDLKKRCDGAANLFGSLLIGNHFITTSALFIQRNCFEAIGGFIALRFVHDWFMFLTLALRSRFSALERSLTYYRLHGSNTIKENDELGRLEDNFVLDWILHEHSRTGMPMLTTEEIIRLLAFNRRVMFELILLFGLWRAKNEYKLQQALAVFGNPRNSVFHCAMKVLRKNRSWRDRLIQLKGRLRALG